MTERIVVKKGGEGIYEEKKSKFIAAVYSVSTEDEIATILEQIRKKYWDARHNCYAYVYGENNEFVKFSDDGEPAGTAGKPILDVITRKGVSNCLIVVTRYFGGTLLGTGGLVRAYTKSSMDAIEASVLARLIPGIRYEITTDYNGIGKIQHVLENFEANIANTEYGEKVIMHIDIQQSETEAFINKITEITNGRAIIKKEMDLPIEVMF